MTRRDPRVFVADALAACDRIVRFTSGRSLEEYRDDDLLRSAVERQFTILGESLARLRTNEPAIAAALPDLARIVAFRNRLVHGYDAIDPTTVWAIATTRVEPLRARLRDLQPPED